MLKIIALALTIVALAGYSLVFISKPKTFVVEMVQDGFLPDKLTVSQGSTVKFINRDIVEKWPASNIHPTHLSYPEFDPQKPIPPAGSWDMKFLKNGRFGYHDHLSPHRKGEVIVNPSWDVFIYITSFMQGSFKEKDTRDNGAITVNIANFPGMTEKEQINMLRKQYQSSGISGVWDTVLTGYSEKKEESGRAHDLAHFIGELIYEGGGIESLGLCKPDFGFGCHHGFTETAFEGGLDTINKIENGCAMKKLLKGNTKRDCYLGIGRGIAAYFASKDLNGSLGACDSLKGMKDICFEGVFISFSVDAPKSFYLKETNPLFPCNKVETRYRNACSKSLPEVLKRYRGMDKDKIKEACIKLQNKTNQDACIKSI